MTHKKGTAFPSDKESGKPRFLISDLCMELESYLEQDQIQEVYRAYLFSAEAHEGQERVSGEPYIYHPVAVARILAGMRMDYQCLMAAILHDVIEDTDTPKEQLSERFGEDIAQLVDGVSKLTQIDFGSQAEAQAASIRKMLLAMTRDIRIILIKLADRLHNMRTLGVMRPEKRRRIASETLEIYTPIASRLGINNIRLELEELCFAAYWPMRYRVLEESVLTIWGNRREMVGKIESALRQRLEQEGFPGQVEGRQKHLFSIYKKMRDKRLSFTELVDVFAFRIIVDTVDTCYRVLGAMHNLYKPVPGHFKDYIAIPKANGYQSLHTVLFGPHGMPIEIQIRTEEMHGMAESGIAAHWLYKSGEAGDDVAHDYASEWLKSLLDIQQGSGDPIEFLEHVKVDLFPDEVYVFTPSGEVMALKKGSTVIDFAYAVHSDVGNHCVSAHVDRQLVPLRSQLYNGQTVEVFTAADSRPNPTWLSFVMTGKARANIRTYLKNLQRKEAVQLGRRMLENELQIYRLSLEELPEAELLSVLEEFKLQGLDELLENIGLGDRMALLVAQRLSGGGERLKGRAVAGHSSSPLAIRGTEGMVVQFAKCCRPIPGDAITALFSPGRGIVIHREECNNLGEFRKQGKNWLDVRWEETPTGGFSTEIVVVVGNERGALAKVSSVIAALDANIENVAVEERDGHTSALKFVVNVRDRKHLAQIMRRVRALPVVFRISRIGF